MLLITRITQIVSYFPVLLAILVTAFAVPGMSTENKIDRILYIKKTSIHEFSQILLQHLSRMEKV